jgi:hypothetical protein
VVMVDGARATPMAPIAGCRGCRVVWVSHAGSDSGWAEWIAWQLKEAGPVELDAWRWRAGDSFVARMNAALDAADVAVAVWSRA